MPSAVYVLSCKFSQKEDACNPNRQQSKIQEDPGSRKCNTAGKHRESPGELDGNGADLKAPEELLQEIN